MDLGSMTDGEDLMGFDHELNVYICLMMNIQSLPTVLLTYSMLNNVPNREGKHVELFPTASFISSIVHVHYMHSILFAP
jgi:hypothetical protein